MYKHFYVTEFIHKKENGRLASPLVKYRSSFEPYAHAIEFGLYLPKVMVFFVFFIKEVKC